MDGNDGAACTALAAGGTGDELTPKAAWVEMLPRIWIMECTFVWLDLWCRLNEDYEGLPATTRAWRYLTLGQLSSHQMRWMGWRERRGGWMYPRSFNEAVQVTLEHQVSTAIIAGEYGIRPNTVRYYRQQMREHRLL